MTKSDLRNSNIELLRLVSMLMVLNVHTFWASDELANINKWGGVFLDFFREAISISCVNLFVLISGYFSIKWRVKSIASLLFQIYFWVFLVYMVAISLGLATMDWKQLYKHCIGFMTAYWFIPAYLGLYVLAPVLNAFVDHTTLKKLGIYIIIFYIFQFVDSLPGSYNMTSLGYSTLSFCGLYLIGRYIKITESCTIGWLSSKRKIGLSILIVTALIAILSILVSVLFKRSGEAIFFPLSPLVYNNPLVVAQSILIFLLFAKIRIQNNFINWCATGALAIYLLHMHPNIKEYFYGFSKELYSLPYLVHILVLPLLFIVVVLVAIPVDKLRQWIFENSYKKLSNAINSEK